MVQPAPSVLGKRGPESHADVELKLRKDVAAPAAARAAVSELVCGLDVTGAFRETLALLVSELVTNAVIHSSTPDGTDVIVTTRVNDEVVRVTVTDGGCGFSYQRPEPTGSPGGYGLRIVEEAADRWDINVGSGTRVWFELARQLAPT
jgi:anti-sigma regulatory factor (Ser/Thr protein kinase)